MTAPISDRIDIRSAATRFNTQTSWLDSHHSFAFSHHRDPANTHHGLLLVSNDDIIQPETGFETHPHRDMEIITWVLRGELEHKDSEGHSGLIYPGLAQRMSAGSGIWHSEMNATPRKNTDPDPNPDNDPDAVHLVQMWVIPDTPRIDPSYQQLDINTELDRGGLVPVASGRGHDAAISIRQQDAVLWAGRLRPNEQTPPSSAGPRSAPRPSAPTPPNPSPTTPADDHHPSPPPFPRPVRAAPRDPPPRHPPTPPQPPPPTTTTRLPPPFLGRSARRPATLRPRPPPFPPRPPLRPHSTVCPSHLHPLSSPLDRQPTPPNSQSPPCCHLPVPYCPDLPAPTPTKPLPPQPQRSLRPPANETQTPFSVHAKRTRGASTPRSARAEQRKSRPYRPALPIEKRSGRAEHQPREAHARSINPAKRTHGASTPRSARTEHQPREAHARSINPAKRTHGASTPRSARTEHQPREAHARSINPAKRTHGASTPRSARTEHQPREAHARSIELAKN